MDLMNSKEAAEKWGITIRRVQALCDSGKIPTATKLANMWIMPKDIAKPIDGRTKIANIKLLESSDG